MGDVVVTKQAAYVLGAHTQLCRYLRGGLRTVVQDASNPVNSWRPTGLGGVPRCSGDVSDVAGKAAAVGPCAECDLFVEARALDAAAVAGVKHLVPTLAAAWVLEIALAGCSGGSG